MTPAMIQLLFALAPQTIPLIKDIVMLFKAHPQLTPEMLSSLVLAIHSANADTLAIVLADQTKPNE